MSQYQSELGELKEVIGKLWKSVDSFKVTTATADQQTQQQITEWTQINLQLLQLLADKTRESTRLAQNYDKLASYLASFERDSQRLNQQIVALSNALRRLKPDSQAHSQENSQERQITAITEHLGLVETALIQMNKQFQHLFKGSYVLERQTTTWIYSVHFFLSWLTVVGLCGAAITHWQDRQRLEQMQAELEYISARSAWTMTKLERLENR
jgi:hypothetical protein